MKAGYVRNIQHDPHVRLKLRKGFRTRWHTGTAICSLTMIRVDANDGSRLSCPAVPGTHVLCDSLGHNFLVSELIWMPNLGYLIHAAYHLCIPCVAAALLAIDFAYTEHPHWHADQRN